MPTHGPICDRAATCQPPTVRPAVGASEPRAEQRGALIRVTPVLSDKCAATPFGTRLVVVMGHSSCGAVAATLQVLRGERSVASDNIRDIVDRIRSSAQTVLEVGSDRSPRTDRRRA